MQTVNFLAREALSAFTELVSKNKEKLLTEDDSTSATINQELITRAGTILQILAITGGKEIYELTDTTIQN